MRTLRTSPIRLLVTAMLALSVSVCCCQAHFVVHGMGADSPDCVATADATPSCCCEQPAEETSDEPTAPEKGCKSCCIKGTGLKDAKPALPAPVVVSLPVLPAVTSPALIASTHIAIRPDTRYDRVEPRTLLRLHCALIV